jgi:hypothetical protein
MDLLCLELTLIERSEKVVPIKKECALSAKGHIYRQTLVEWRLGETTANNVVLREPADFYAELLNKWISCSTPA